MQPQLTLSTRHGQLLEETQAHLREKAEKLTHLFDRLLRIAITVDMKHENDREVEILVSAEHKHDFVAREKHHDILTAMDKALDHIKQQLRRYKERIQHHRGEPSASDVARGLDGAAS